MEFMSDELERATIQFYHSDSVTQAQAHQYLTAAKSSPQAWAFVWELLQPHKATEVQFYAATTLHSKVEKCLHELTPEEVSALKDRLMTCVVTYSTGPKIVLNRLCVSLSAYLLRTAPETWKDALPELLHTFTPESLPNVPINRVIWVLLEILSLIPEEKGLLRNELEKHQGEVVALLESALTCQSDEETVSQAVKCIASWATIAVLLSQSHTISDRLVSIIFNYHKLHAGICEKSLEALGAIIIHPTASDYPTHLLEFLSKILSLREIIARETLNPDGADKAMVRNVYSLLITFGETHSVLLTKWIKAGGAAREHVLALVTALLHCSGAPGTYPVDESHSRLAFGFWYLLQDHIVACDDPADYELCMSLLGPVYRDLVNVLMNKAMLPAHGHILSREDAESFRCYRQDIGDTMMYCFSILRETTLSLIKTRLEKMEEMSWQQLEACLFSLCSVAENVDLEEVTFLPTLFRYIRHLPYDRLDPKVLCTALDTVGAFAEWIATNNEALEQILPLIPIGLNVPEAAPNATMALKDLTRDCITALAPFATQILDASQKALHSGRLKLNDSLRLMCSVGRLLAKMAAETLYPSLEVVVSPYFTLLDTYAHQRTVEAKSHVLTCLKMLGTLTAAMNTRCDGEGEGESCAPLYNPPQPYSHPALLILQKLLPVLKHIASVWGNDSSVMQSVYVLLKHAVSNLLDDSEPAIGDILALIVSSYRVCPEPAALDLARQLCLLFGKEEKCVLVMQSLMRELCSVTMAAVSSSSTLSDHTDLLHEFFVLLSQTVKKIPHIFAFGSNEDCVALVHCATLTLGVAELPTVKAATAFLVSFICQSRELPALSNVVNVCGEPLVQKIIALIGGEASRNNVEPLADILLALNKKYCDNHTRWLHQAVCESLCHRATPQQRETFIRSILRDRTNKRKLQEHVQEFSLMCRGLIVTQVLPSQQLRHN